MAYDKTKPRAAGVAAVALIYALKDGLQLDQDADELITLITALGVAVEAFQADTDAAASHFIAGAAEEFGDRRVDPPTTP